MPIPTAITDLSTTAASNFPQGTDSPSSLDDVQRAHASFIANLRDGNTFQSGYKTNMAMGVADQNSQSTAYTFVLADAGKHVLHPMADTTARTFTIPANASVAFPIGTCLTIANQHGAGVVTIAITTDAMYFAGVGTTGSRTLAANGLATALKVTATEWLISGAGLT